MNQTLKAAVEEDLRGKGCDLLNIIATRACRALKDVSYRQPRVRLTYRHAPYSKEQRMSKTLGLDYRIAVYFARLVGCCC